MVILYLSDTNLPDSLRDPPATTITLTLLVALATLPIAISSPKLGRKIVQLPRWFPQ